jgi:hypothetical protein
VWGSGRASTLPAARRLAPSSVCAASRAMRAMAWGSGFSVQGLGCIGFILGGFAVQGQESGVEGPQFKVPR